MHVAVDDHSRLAYAEELTDESPATTVAFLDRARSFFAGQGITIERVLTDNGTAYRSRAFIAACDARGIGRRRTRPYRPQTNGKAEPRGPGSVRRRAAVQGSSAPCSPNGPTPGP